jgi:hypothetical protein
LIDAANQTQSGTIVASIVTSPTDGKTRSGKLPVGGEVGGGEVGGGTIARLV